MSRMQHWVALWEEEKARRGEHSPPDPPPARKSNFLEKYRDILVRRPELADMKHTRQRRYREKKKREEQYAMRLEWKAMEKRWAEGWFAAPWEVRRWQRELKRRGRSMTYLYNCRKMNDDWVITKFDTNLNVESSYHVSHSECECPRGNKSTCRHRLMLPIFLKAKHVDDGWFLEYETRLWTAPPSEIAEQLRQAGIAEPVDIGQPEGVEVLRFAESINDPHSPATDPATRPVAEAPEKQVPSPARSGASGLRIRRIGTEK